MYPTFHKQLYLVLAGKRPIPESVAESLWNNLIQDVFKLKGAVLLECLIISLATCQTQLATVRSFSTVFVWHIELFRKLPQKGQLTRYWNRVCVF